MRLDPVTSLAFAVHSSPGTYALLIGSGVSSAAGIPTGWAIVLDLIRRVAELEGADAGQDSERWFRERFGEAADYAKLLDRIAKTQAERQALLRRYIEPSEEDRRAGLKVPTDAHRAIARLVASGHVRIILTTNFDRLIETAIEEAGVPVDVIDSVDALLGARPIDQGRCVLVKLHGDYRDARIRNTPAELERYEPEMNRLLDRILDEHGLIVSGWSARWDLALRDAIRRQPNRRYTTYWASHADPTAEAAELISARGAELLAGHDATRLFVTFESRVRSLAELDRPHPLSVATAVAELKRYLADPLARIQLEDLLSRETERVLEQCSDETFPVSAAHTSPHEERTRIARYTAATEVLAGLFATGGHYAEGDEQARLWAKALERLLNREGARGGSAVLLALRSYPAVRCFYAAGITAMARPNWPVLREIFFGGEFREDDRARGPLIYGLQPQLAFAYTNPQAILHPERPLTSRIWTPVSDHLHDTLREPLRALLPSERGFTVAFDRLELLMGMVLYDLSEHRGSALGPRYRMLVGSFGWRRYIDDEDHVFRWAEGLKAQGSAAVPLAFGFFGGEAARLETALGVAVEVTKNKNMW